MDIKLYFTTSPDNRMTKYLLNESIMQGTLRDVSNVVNPVVLIERDISQLSGIYNYVYIPEFHRYYFINEMQSYRNDFVLLSLTVDVLFSFKNQILDNVAIVDKAQQEEFSNIYYDDGSFITEARDFYTIKTFDNGFNDDGEFILITAGGGGVIQGGDE